jgi:molybdopterin converting factor small subunit
MSGGGVHESLDRGRSWRPLVKGMEVVEGFDPADITFHDPHCVRLCPSDPDRLYQQNHCGIYRIDRPSDEWVRIGRSMPGRTGDIGFPMVVHPRHADTAWVFPMDGTTVWPRTSPDGRPVDAGMRVRIPTPLRSYTGRREVEASGATLAAVLDDLDRQSPGFRFRVVDEQERARPHVRFFVNGEQVFDLARSLRPDDALVIVPALSGG